MRIVPRNWADFQHYKDRNPPWIRLHKVLLDNYEFQSLPVASRALAPMLWLIASDVQDGVIDADLKKLAFRLRRSEQEISEGLKPLIDNGFFECEKDASELLTERKQVDVPEAEALQRHSREEKSAKRASPIPCPEDVDPQVWSDWLQLRKTKKAPVTQTVIDGALAESVKAGLTLEDFLRVWCRRGSQGLDAAWLKPEERGNGPPGQDRKSRQLETAGLMTGSSTRTARPLETIDAESRFLPS